MKTYTIFQAAEIFQCHHQTIRQHIHFGLLKASKPGRAYCIKESDLEDFLDNLHNVRVQASLERESEQNCQFINEKARFGTSILSHKVAKELDEVLARPMKHKNCTTN